jgi:hypothetical protein
MQVKTFLENLAEIIGNGTTVTQKNAILWKLWRYAACTAMCQGLQGTCHTFILRDCFLGLFNDVVSVWDYV